VHEVGGGGWADGNAVEQDRRSQTGQKRNTVGPRAEKNTKKRWWVRRTRGHQRRDRQAPRWPATAPAEDDHASDDGSGGSMRGGGGTADRRIDAGGRVVVAPWPHGGHLDLTADGAFKWRAHRRTRRLGGSCPELA